MGWLTSAKKSLPLSSTTTNAGKSTTSIRQIGLHAELGVLQHLDLADAVLRQPGRGPADRAQVEAAVRGARRGDLLAAVALREHHQRAARGLELLDVGVHAARRGGPERAGRVPGGGLGGPGVVDGVVAQVVGHRLARLQPLGDLRVGDVAGHDQRAGQRHARLDRQRRELGADRVHRPVEVDLDDVARQVLGRGLGQEARGVGLQPLQEDALRRDLGLGLAVGRAGHRDAHRERRAVPGQPDHAHVVAEVLAAELGADAELAGELQDLLFEVAVAERVAELGARARQRVEVARRRQLGDLEVVLGRHAADDDRQVVGRAGGGAERAQLLVEERRQPPRGAAAPSSPGRGTSCWPNRRPWPAPAARTSAPGPAPSTARPGRAGWCRCCARPRTRWAPSASSAGGARRRPRRCRGRWPPRRCRRSAPSPCACRRRSRCRCPGTSAARRPRRRTRCAAGRPRRTGRWATPRDRRRSRGAARGARGAAGAGCRARPRGRGR